MLFEISTMLKILYCALSFFLKFALLCVHELVRGRTGDTTWCWDWDNSRIFSPRIKVPLIRIPQPPWLMHRRRDPTAAEPSGMPPSLAFLIHRSYASSRKPTTTATWSALDPEGATSPKGGCGEILVDRGTWERDGRDTRPIL